MTSPTFALLLSALAACSQSSGGTQLGAGGGGTGGSSGQSSTSGASTGTASTGTASTSGASTGTASSGTGNTPTGPVFYVATTGDDTSSGSITAPWKTITHAMHTVTAGVTVRVRAGVYGEQVSIGVSGASGSPITLESYPGEVAIVDGTHVPTVDGTGLVDVSSQSHLVIRGLEVRNWTATEVAEIAGISVVGASTDVQLLNNHVHDIVITPENVAGGHGVSIEGTSTTAISALVVHGNEIDHVRTGFGESLTINGNVDGFEISNNLIHDNDNIGMDIAGAYGIGPTTALDVAHNGVVRQNTIFNITGRNNPAYGGSDGAAGVYVDGGAAVLVEQNIIHNVDYGVAMESENSGHAASYVLVRNNVVYYSNDGGVSVGGYSAAVGGADHCVIVNNTLYENSTELTLGTHMTSVVCENNLAYSASGEFQEGTSANATVDHDVNLQTGASTVFVDAGTAPNGAVAVDLHVASGSLSKVRDQGVQLSCPSGWTCPAVWGASPLNGTLDAGGQPRTSAAGIDVGAYQAQ